MLDAGPERGALARRGPGRRGAVAVYIAGDEKFERRFGRADGVWRSDERVTRPRAVRPPGTVHGLRGVPVGGQARRRSAGGCVLLAMLPRRWLVPKRTRIVGPIANLLANASAIRLLCRRRQDPRARRLGATTRCTRSTAPLVRPLQTCAGSGSSRRVANSLYDSFFGRSVTTGYYRDLIDASPATARNDLQAAVAAGFLRAIGQTRGRRYEPGGRLMPDLSRALGGEVLPDQAAILDALVDRAHEAADLLPDPDALAGQQTLPGLP